MIALMRLSGAVAAAVAIVVMMAGCSAPYSNDPSFTESAPGNHPVDPVTGSPAPAELLQGSGGG